MKKILKSLLVAVGLFPLICKLIGGWKRAFPKDIVREYFRKPGPKMLQIGSGINVYPGWLNTDYEPVIPGTLRMDATKPFPFKDKSFDYIFCQHMIEHIGYQDGQFMLRECLRVLKPGGKVRISTPNLAMVCGLYRRPEELSELQNAYLHWSQETWVPDAPKARPAFVINNFFRNWGHQFIYDAETLSEAIERVGFCQVKAFALNASEDPVFQNLENEKRLPEGFLAMETITFEGRK
jgi:predicted SAM-dependent methyltransferase